MSTTPKPRGFITEEQHERFAQHYAVYRNGKAAMTAAGILSSMLPAALLGRASVKRRIQEIWGTAAEAAEVTPERVLKEIARVAFQSAHDLYDTDGRLLEPHELPDDAAATISGIDIETRREGQGRDLPPIVVETKKVRRYDKMAALGILARYVKIVGAEDDGSSAAVSALAAKLNAGLKRAYEAKTLDNTTEDARIIQPVPLPAPVEMPRDDSDLWR